MFISLLMNSPYIAVVWIVVILLSITVHEFAHAYVGTLKGDKTAQEAGRLTLNPLAHIDPVGIIPLLLLGFGWAKPVPFNPYNLKNPKRDAVDIALAGPFANLVLAVLAAVAFRGLSFAGVMTSTSLLPVFLMFFNIVPIYPLDGSKLVDAILTKPAQQPLRLAIAKYGPQVLFVLVIISLLTNFNVFFFVNIPAFLTCDFLLGGSCSGFLGSIF